MEPYYIRLGEGGHMLNIGTLNILKIAHINFLIYIKIVHHRESFYFRLLHWVGNKKPMDVEIRLPQLDGTTLTISTTVKSLGVI